MRTEEDSYVIGTGCDVDGADCAILTFRFLY